MKLGDFHLVNGVKEKQELHAVVERFNQTTREYPRDKTVHAVFAGQAARTPDAVALRHAEGSHTYRELDEYSNRLARFLHTWGLPREAFVGILLEKSLELMSAILGILKVGGAYFPLDTNAPLERSKYLLRDAQTSILFTEKRFIRRANQLQWECPHLRAIFCLDSDDVLREPEELGEFMKKEVWEYVGEKTFDDISGGGWKSSYTGEWLSREVMDEYGENIRAKLTPWLTPQTRILEIGCSSGISMFRLAPQVEFYYGTDLSESILHWTEHERQRRALDNIHLHRLAAHEIDQVGKMNFDGVILNSVLQCFSGHNYLRDVLRKAITLINEEGWIFLGNVWDQDLKDDFIRSLIEFQRNNQGKGYHTTTDHSETLFLSRAFLEDLRHDFPEIAIIEDSSMIGKERSELSDYGYDVLLRINKKRNSPADLKPRHKQQLDRRALNGISSEPVEERSGPRSLAYVMYTSGTSGRPKGVMVEHRSILRLVINTNYIELHPTDRILQTGALSFDASTLEFWGPLLQGGEVCRAPEKAILDAAQLKYWIRQFGVTVMWLTSSLFNQLADADRTLFTGLRCLLVGGEKLSPRHINQVKKTFPNLILINGYGPTENTTFTACHHIEQCYERDIPIGRPVANTQVYILDGKFELTPVGVPGEICAGGDGLARGYLNDPELTRKKFIDHPYKPGERLYRTGDLGRWLPDGTIEYIGRMDEQIKIRGFRIEPMEIENRIRELNGIREIVVLARKNGEGIYELTAYITGEQNLDSHELREALKQELPDYMIPAHFVVLEKMPLNKNGKVDRSALPDPERPLFKKDHQTPVTETEKRLVAIWEEVLGYSGIGITDNFFDSGGHSLKVTKVVSLIEKYLGVIVPLTVIFKAPTVRELAPYILDHARYGWRDIDEVMVHLNGEVQGPVIFAFPPGTGDAAGFIQIAECLKPYAFYGFNFIEADSRITDYADRVMSVDSKGPYVFFGYSSGGNLAYHVAREMQQRGRQVVDIIMIDSGRKMATFKFREEEIQEICVEFLGHESMRPYLTHPILREKAERLIRCSYAYFENSVDHHVISANIHLLLSEDSADVFHDSRGRVLSNKRGWAEATTGTFHVHQGTGGHNTMLYEPYVQTNAQWILSILSAIFSSMRKEG